MEIKPIAYIHNDYRQKFGIPRQSGLAEAESTIVFEKPYRSMDAVRGLEGFSHIWLIWDFSEAHPQQEDSPRTTVRPPRLGGDVRMGVFATRSPFRPNPLGLSSVRLKEIRETPNGPVLVVTGADLMDNTPVFDIKPYLQTFDCHPDAAEGFVETNTYRTLTVRFPQELRDLIPKEKHRPLIQALEQDPRPHYQNDSERIYGMSYGDFNIRFMVDDTVLTVIDVQKQDSGH